VTPADVLVVVVSRDTRDAAVRAVRSVLEHGAVPGRATRCVLVDNASSDGTVEAVRTACGDRVEIVANLRNAGFGAACNQGAAMDPAARHVLFLNADAELLPGALTALVAELEAHPDAAACGPALVGADGAPQPSVRGHPTRLALLHQHTALRFLRVGAAAYRRYKAPRVPSAGGLVDVVMGACLLVRSDAFRAASGFDPRYFLYFEEADLERRLPALPPPHAGVVRFVPHAVVRHAGGESRRRDPERALTWYLESLLLYVDRWHGRAAGLAFRCVFKPLFVVRLATDALRDALVLAFRGRAAKADELRLAARFAVRGLWRFLAA
jgi:N-acetylglucosaminyl-diphospho-decaprenol L-rhamnosyltransferase